ncbi:EamA-like transporter family protein [Agromyces sp. CF514]|uniref:EamA family transporter n=1 Tax=Agromyces sp. CF514 TaxID=1881031 RepID=UPI0008EE18A6|nr:EamA family transporter [Agromyces sp. CF514]SFR84064.1 EamA-like transporter family protein [Agromyces sp. CF514]
MLTAVFSLTGALVFGAADFLGGLAAKRISALLATAVAALSGVVLLLLALPLLGGEWTAHDVLWGAISGVVGCIGIALLYACLAIGPMSILSPTTAVVSAIVPVLYGLVVGGERFGPIGYWGLGLALVAVVLVGFVPERGAVRPSLRGILMAVGSGAAIGGFYIAIDQTSDESGIVPLILNRGVNAALMFAAVAIVAVVAAARARRVRAVVDAGAVTRPSAGLTADASGGRMPRAARPALAAGIRLAVACGVVDATANALLLFGIRAGDLSIAAVLGAMYPAGTILLAALVLRERIAPVQWAGLVLALAAAAMLALA